MTLRRTLIIIGSAAIVALMAGGCSDDPDVSTDTSPEPVATVGQGQPTPTPASETEPGKAVRAYVEALASSDNPQEMRDGLNYAAEDSVAYVYLAHLTNLAESWLDGGTPFNGSDITETGDGYRLCDDTETCNIFSGFKAVDGKISDLTVNGEKVGPRLTAGNGETVTERDVTGEFMTAYNSIAGDTLWITIRVTSSSEPVELLQFEATYRAPDGKQRQATDAFGPYELGADSNAMVSLGFSGVEPGGEVTLPGWNSSFDDFTLRFQVS